MLNAAADVYSLTVGIHRGYGQPVIDADEAIYTSEQLSSRHYR